MTNIERARELWAEQLRTAPAGEYAARSMLETPSPHDERVLRAIVKALDRPEPVEDGLIGELRALLEKATPGEWKVTADGCGIYAQYGDIADMVLNDKAANAALIVFLRNNAEALLSRIAKAPVEDGVTQADRDAACLRIPDRDARGMVRGGDWDGHLLVQLLRRHRLGLPPSTETEGE